MYMTLDTDSVTQLSESIRRVVSCRSVVSGNPTHTHTHTHTYTRTHTHRKKLETDSTSSRRLPQIQRDLRKGDFEMHGR